jgi:uncharacterized protein
MQQQVILKLTPIDASNEAIVTKTIANKLAVKETTITGYNVLKRSLDARAKTIWVNLTVEAFINEPKKPILLLPVNFNQVKNAKHQVIIVGAGPAGYFAALQLLQLGIKPIIIERGKDVQARRRDLAQLNKNGTLNPESNYCFGEGGAGTYSDGKLYTRSSKRGSITEILHHFVRFGASEEILYQAHPHIGTNKLPNIMVAMRLQIIDSGGQVYFNEKLIDFKIENDTITAAITTNNIFKADAFILATGHSAQDIFYLLQQKNIAIEAKSFALGVRVEHPQELINNCQYKSHATSPFLPPAAYSLVQQVEQRGVFSFCMCPGGIIAPAATMPNQLVVNGWSPSKRNNDKANSGMVVQVHQKDVVPFLPKSNSNDPLLLLNFQKMVEQKCFTDGGGNFAAPAQRLVDFCTNKLSATLPKCSYHPGLNSVVLKNTLPQFIQQSLAGAFMAFGKKMRGFYTNEAVVVATESRTSSPVRIPRHNDTLQHTQIKNLYPCAEGAGYAGGIVSAAMDGQNVAKAIANFLKPI